VQEEFPFAHRVAFVDPDKAVKAIEEERIDMFIHDAPTIWWAASVREDSGYTPVPIFLTSEELAWGIRYDDTDLLKAANGFIETWKRDGRLKASIKKWIPYAN
jgi:polar amino acid transport system substrate-binding protein